MKKFSILLFLSLLGLTVGVITVIYGDTLMSSNTVAVPHIKLPYKSFIAGNGIVESASKNTFIGSQVSGIVSQVYVQSGDKISKGELLFELDSTDLQYKILVEKENIKASKARYLSAKHQFELLKKLKKLDTQLITSDKYIKAQDDLKETQSLVNLAQSKLNALQYEIKLYNIHSPIDGIVLKSEVNVGDFFDKNSKYFLIGSDNLNLRVSINENDVWKFKSKTNAIAFVRGDSKHAIELHYKYTIPYVVAKTNLTGLGTEKTDTRVLQIIYSVASKLEFPLYVGEQLDVFIEN